MDTRESACPFCGAVVRRVEGWSVLGLGFMIGLATSACGDKSGTSDSAGSSSTSSMDGTAGTTGTTDGETMISETALPTESGAGTAYAGPDVTDTLPDDTSTSTGNTETGTETETGTGTGSSTGTGTETDTDTDFPDTSAYAGPDVQDDLPELN